MLATSSLKERKDKSKRRIKKEFDEKVEGFHFYDVTFCFQNFLESVGVGVTTRVLLLIFVATILAVVVIIVGIRAVVNNIILIISIVTRVIILNRHGLLWLRC